MTTAGKALAVSAFFVVLLHIWGTLQPSHDNWGVHFFALYNSAIGLLAVAIVIAVSVPRIQVLVTNGIEVVLRFFARFPVVISYLTALGIVTGAAFLFSPPLHLLGDGAILIRSIPRAQWGDDILSSFRNQPLLEIIYRWVMNFYPSNAHPSEIYFMIDLVGAALFLIVLFWGMRNLQRPLFEKFLLGVLLFFGAGCQFFLGYVENYVLQYVVTTAYVISGWLALEKKAHILVPIALFAVLPGLSMPSLIFAPSVAFLIFWQFKERKAIAFGILGGIGIAGLAILFLIGFNLENFFRHLTQGSVDFLPPFTTYGGYFAYPVFSWLHLLDLFNTHWLIAPFGLLVSITLMFGLPKGSFKDSPALLFLLLATLCGLLFTVIVNAALGMARDWDMLSSFLIPLMVLGIYLLAASDTYQPRRYILVMIVTVTVCHSIAWVGTNASYDRHLARAKMLNSRELLSLASQMAYNEALANFFFDTHQYADAKTYYIQYMKIDSFNQRILGNISDVYRKLNEKENYFESLKRAVRLGSKNPGIYSNLGVEYAGRNDTVNAIALNEQALIIDPRQQKAHANLGILYMSKKEYSRSDQHFTAAIALGMRDQVLFRYAGDVAVVVGDYPRALRYYDSYLELSPNDERVRGIRERVREIVRKSKN